MLKRSSKNYYSKMWDVTNQIFEKYNMQQYMNYNYEEEKVLLKEIYIEKLYNFLLDLVNQEIYDYIKEFSQDEIEFMINFEIDEVLSEIINLIYKNINIKKIKRKLNKMSKNNM